ncbi:MAG: DDE-type integrase/transposase/recombinase [Deltaproteobacteria bacterium]|nr:DDE-type integrase/transposase/recombinase [Deltaproteobacteria bacterium]
MRVLRGTPFGTAVREVAALDHVGLDGRPRRVSTRSIQRWFAAWSAGGIAGLAPTPRAPQASHVLEPALVAFLAAEKRADSRVSVPEALRRATVAGLIGSPEDVDRTTAWRALDRLGVQTNRGKACARDQRRFAKENRLQIVLCDGKHFRAGQQGLRRVALFFIDDATRYTPHVVVGPSESALLFLRGLHGLLLRVGKCDLLYHDHGSAFTADDSHAVLGNLDIGYVHGTVGYPPGRGKIERFNRTAEDAILRDLAREEVDPDCMALELRLAHYLAHDYNRQPHESLQGQTPEARFFADERPLRPYTDEDLRQKFFVREERVVSNDHVISFDSVFYEVPRGLSGQRVTIARDLLDPSHLRLDHEGQSLRLHPVDLHANARARRGTHTPPPDPTPPSVGAARRAADRALAPITQPDGGFPATDSEKEPSWN